jgi:hypothetical protein
MKKAIKIVLFFAVIVISLSFYPIDGYNSTGITRLLDLNEKFNNGDVIKRIPKGALHCIDSVKLNLINSNNKNLEDVFTKDETLSKKIKGLLPRGAYSITVLDMTDPNDLKYAAVNENKGYQPGSVGKLVVLNAFFKELKKIYPDSWKERVELLRNKKVTSRYWGVGDIHTIPVYNAETKKLRRRKVVASDDFTLYEWLDHMVSVSNNGAASIVFRETVSMNVFGKDYPSLSNEQAEDFFNEIKRDSLRNLAHSVINNPLREIGISEKEWRLGGPFTRNSSNKVGRKGGSLATPLGLMKFVVQLEQGNIVDKESSLEMKRLIYLTDRRIRYAKAPRLDDARVYYKSGSYYSGGSGKYKGSKFNYMNSVIIVEHPETQKKYAVCLMTNILNKNSASDHYYLGGKIDKMLVNN